MINRFGFNSAGHAKARENLRARKAGGIVGINLGANRNSNDRIADFVAGIGAFAEVASYFTINISSPNTPGLRDLQQARGTRRPPCARRRGARARCARRPLLLKIAPDLSLHELDEIVRIARDRKMDGMIVSNTTVARPDSLVSPQAKESGGLSGRPLFDMATRMLAQTFQRVEGQFPLVGVGGIDGPDAAFAKLEAGASVLQLYSGLVFGGPQLITRIKRGIIARMEREGVTSLAGVIGRRAADYAEA